jgi:ATP-dependent DNA helicase RecG
MTAYGPVTVYEGLQMVAPDYVLEESDEADERFGCLVPVYPLTEGINQRLMRSVVRSALDAGAAHMPEIFPRGFLSERGMPFVEKTVWDIHFPPAPEELEAARQRMAYEELFIFRRPWHCAACT